VGTGWTRRRRGSGASFTPRPTTCHYTNHAARCQNAQRRDSRRRHASWKRYLAGICENVQAMGAHPCHLPPPTVRAAWRAAALPRGTCPCILPSTSRTSIPYRRHRTPQPCLDKHRGRWWAFGQQRRRMNDRQPQTRDAVRRLTTRNGYALADALATRLSPQRAGGHLFGVPRRYQYLLTLFPSRPAGKVTTLYSCFCLSFRGCLHAGREPGRLPPNMHRI